MKILSTTPNLYNSNNKIQKGFTKQQLPIQFTGIAPAVEKTGLSKSFSDFVSKNYNKVMEPVENSIAKGLAWLLERKPALKLVKHIETAQKKKEVYNEQIKIINAKIAETNKNITDKSNIIKELKARPKRLFSHLIVLGSALMSGFYVSKTLNNDKLDSKKKKTLAINQTAVFALSTVMAYTFDDMISKKTEAIKAKFKKINEAAIDIKCTAEEKSLASKKIDIHLKGIEAAKKILIFTTMYRFIAPVIVTPLANAIGNRLNEKK